MGEDGITHDCVSNPPLKEIRSLHYLNKRGTEQGEVGRGGIKGEIGHEKICKRNNLCMIYKLHIKS